MATLALLIGALLASIALAQVLYGSLTGIVTDQSGAAIAGAKIVALNVDTGVSSDVTSNESGVYRFATLLPGNYRVTVSAANFASQVTESVRVTVNTVVRVDAALKLGQQKEVLTITAEPPLLQTDKADVHTDLTAKEVANLPITSSVGGRNFQSLLRVVPGFGNLTEQNSAGANPQRALSTNVNGQSLQGINTRIDGVQDAYPWLPGNVAYVPPAEAIETVNVVTNSFDAEQGSAAGAAVNVQIKSGTNKFHGSGFEFFTDHNLRTRNFFQTEARLPKKPLNIKHQYGGTIGGPIIKDKLFFFGDYQRTTQRGVGSPILTLPTAAMRGGDFSAFIPAGQNCNTVTDKKGCIFDPTTGLAFPGNIIPAGRIDPAATALINLLPSTSSSGTTNNFNPVGIGAYNVDNFDIKVNYIPGANSTFFSRYSMSRSSILDPPTLGQAGGDATNGGQLGNANGRIQSVGLGGTYSFSPNLLFDWNAGFTRQRLGATALDIGTAFGLNVMGIPGTNGFGTTGDPSLYNGIPAVQISSVANMGNPNTGNPFLFRDNQYVTGENLSWIHGKHAFRVGFEYNHTQMNHFQPQGSDGNFTTARGSFNFNGNLTSVGGAQNPANSFAQFLLGLPNRAGKATLLFNPVALRWSQYAFYLRDQWQIVPQLTLTLGVRWEHYPFGYSDENRGLPIFNPADGNVYIGGLGNVPKNSGVDTHLGMLLPRVGLAYRITNKTVLRTGFGISTDPNNYHFLRNAFPSTITTDPVGGSGTTPAIISLTGTNAVGLLSALPVGLTPLLTPLPDLSSGIVPLPAGKGTRTWPTDFRRGYINSFNFSLQQEYKGFTAEAAYVGARAIRPLTNININAAPICPAVIGGVARPISSSALCLANGYGRLLNPDNTNVARRWGGISTQAAFGNNYYDSLQTKITRRFGGSLVGATYTFSKSINYAENEDLGGLFQHAPSLWNRDKALSGFDRTHNFQAYAVYELPFGRGKRWATGGFGSALAGGWQVNAVLSRLSGTPFSVLANNTLLNPAVQDGLNNTASMVGTYKVLHHSKPFTGATGSCPISDLSCHYFDPAAFAQPGIGVLGNTGRNQFRGPGIFDADLSLFRDFKLTERFTFQFRAEVFGLTNTPRFNNPNNTCGSPIQQGTPTVDTPTTLCSTAAANNNFGTITATNGSSGSGASTDGTRTIWFAGKLTF